MMLDRFSDLPDHVAHHILSFLTVTHLARFECVSKRCRKLCLSADHVSFKDFSPGNTSTCASRERLLDPLDRFLCRRGDNKIQKFHVCWSYGCSDDSVELPLLCEDEAFQIMAWVLYAVRGNVEELHLDASWLKAPIPSCVLCCQYLRSLVVDGYYVILKAPSFGLFSNLRSLKLRCCIIDQEFWKWISCNCKCLRELVLNCVKAENVTIENTSLELFSFWVEETYTINISGEKLEQIRIHRHLDLDKTSLSIFAPRVKRLILKGESSSHQNLGKFEFIESAKIHLSPNEDCGSISEVLCSVCRVESLSLDELTIEALFQKGSLPLLLVNVSYLVLKIGSFVDELVPAVVSLFRIMPNLCKLYVRFDPRFKDDSKPNTFGCDRGYWKKQNLVFDHLKDVIIKLHRNEPNAFEFIEYLKEQAPNLEEAVLQLTC